MEALMRRYQGTLHRDWDDDKVSFEDEMAQGTMLSSRSNSMDAKEAKESTNYRPLFQYRRFKGELDNSFVSDKAIDVEVDNTEQFCDNFDLNSLQTKSYVINKESSARLKDTNSFIGRNAMSPQPQTHRVSENKQSLHKRERVTTNPRDVATDRPNHWQSVEFKRRSTTSNAKSATTVGARPPVASTAVAGSTKLKPKTKIVSMSSRPLTIATPRSSDLIHNISFQPSWMTSMLPDTSADTAMANRRSTTSAAHHGRELDEDIVEDIVPAAAADSRKRRKELHSSRASNPVPSLPHYEDHSYNDHMDADHNIDEQQQPVHTYSSQVLTSPPPRVVNTSNVMSPAYTGSGGPHRGKHSSSSAKVKPGTLRARLQKILRDADANETRIISILQPLCLSTMEQDPVFDLQNPRSRCNMHMDLEVTNVFADQFPFRVVKVQVISMWNRVLPVTTPAVNTTLFPKTPGSDLKSVNRSEDLDRTTLGSVTSLERTTVDADRTTLGDISPIHAHDTSSADNTLSVDLLRYGATARKQPREGDSVTRLCEDEGSHVMECSDMLLETPGKDGDSLCPFLGQHSIVYFKPSTCVGTQRALKEGLTLRIYDPVILPASQDTQSAYDVKYVMVGTNCWEPTLDAPIRRSY